MDLYHLLTPAVLSYEGIAFQYMAPSVFEDSQFEYVQNHLRIISAFYGVLKPRGWCDALSFGNAGEGWNRGNKKSV